MTVFTREESQSDGVEYEDSYKGTYRKEQCESASSEAASSREVRYVNQRSIVDDLWRTRRRWGLLAEKAIVQMRSRSACEHRTSTSTSDCLTGFACSAAPRAVEISRSKSARGLYDFEAFDFMIQTLHWPAGLVLKTRVMVDMSVIRS